MAILVTGGAGLIGSNDVLDRLRPGIKTCCPEAAAFHEGCLSAAGLRAIAEPLAGGAYVDYLSSLPDGGGA